jgi:hypothetical protein
MVRYSYDAAILTQNFLCTTTVLKVKCDSPMQALRALVIVVMGDPIGGLPCFELGVAVPEAYRSQGRAKKTVEAAIAELKHGLARNKISTFYVEAVVGTANEASKRVAAAVISASPVAGTDHLSWLPALQYVRKIG